MEYKIIIIWHLRIPYLHILLCFTDLGQTSTLSPTLNGNYRSPCFVKVSTGQECGGQGRHKQRQVSGREAQQIYSSMCAVTWKYERKPIWRSQEKVIIVLHLPEVGNLTEKGFGQKVWPRDNKLRGNQQPLLTYLLLGLSTPGSWPSNRSPEHWEIGVLWPSFKGREQAESDLSKSCGLLWEIQVLFLWLTREKRNSAFHNPFWKRKEMGKSQTSGLWSHSLSFGSKHLRIISLERWYHFFSFQWRSPTPQLWVSPNSRLKSICPKAAKFDASWFMN